MKNTSNNKALTELVGHIIYDNGVDNDTLVQIIELCGNALNLKTIPEYAKANNMSYNGVKHNRSINELFGVKFVIDNH